MIIGNFSYDSEFDYYAGELTTLTIRLEDVVIRAIEKSGEKSPDYRVIQERDGVAVELGAAWKRTSDQGRKFLSVSLDDPTLPSSLNAALFMSDTTGQAILVWERREKDAPKVSSRPGSQRPRKASAGSRPS